MGEEVVHAIPFLKGSRWEGAVEVVRLERHPVGPVISLRIRIGHRFLVLPRRSLEEVAAALVEGGKVARKLYQQTIEKKAPQ
jgi:hypothetical protein